MSPRLALPSVLVLALVAACGREERSAPAELGVDALRSAAKDRATILDPRTERIGRFVPDLAFETIDGRATSLSAFAGGPLVVVVRDVSCPVSRRIGPRTARLEDEYVARGVGFLFVDMSPQDTPADIREESAAFGFEGPYVHDPGGRFGRALGARTTTEVFVLDRARTLVYRGAIDDQHGRGVTLPEARSEYLRAALDALLAGERIDVEATSSPGCYLGLEPAESAPVRAEELTWHREVSRIVQQSCVGCHREGGAGPFPLTSWRDVAGRKAMVRYVVENGVMPPWLASDDTGPWANDHRLRADERASILAWIAAGCAEGDAADAPVPRSFPEGWSIGEPDLVFSFPEPFPVPADGLIDLQRVFAESVVPRDVWVKRAELRPGVPQVVHHATVMFKPPPDRAAPGGLFDRLLHRDRLEGWRFLFAYLPGKGPREYEDGVARFLPKGSRIRFEMHYTPNGVAALDASRLGLVLADAPPRFAAESRLVRNYAVSLAPGEAGARFRVQYALPRTVLLRGLLPHMHLRGRSFLVELVARDGTLTKLLELERWDPDWQFDYVFRDPPLVEEGTIIRVTATYDNSSANPNNPDPTRAVKDGPQIDDEMLLLAVEWIEPR